MGTIREVVIVDVTDPTDPHITARLQNNQRT